MLNNVEERKTVRTGTIAVFAVLLIHMFRDSAYRFQGWNEYASLYLLAGVASASIGFSIFTQGWIYFSSQLSRQRLYTGMLFLSMLVFDLLHMMGAVGFPLFRNTLSLNESLWLLVLSKILASGGILLIFGFRDGAVDRRFKTVLLAAGVTITVSVLTLFFSGGQELPLLSDENALTPMKSGIDIGIMAVFLVAAATILYKGRIEKPPALLIIVRGLLFFAVGQFLFAESSYVTDLYHLLGLAFGCIGSYFVLRGSYRLTIQDPLEERRQAEAQISYLAYHDDLTGLPNLRKLVQRLEDLLQSDGPEAEPAVIVLNFNRFKMINESLGRHAGDRILKLASERITREAADKGEEVFSMGGDEFAIILPDKLELEEIRSRIGRYIDLFQEPLAFGTREYHLSLSAGFAVYPEDGLTADRLVQNADTAVHDAKGQQSSIQRYLPSMQQKAQNRLVLESEMRRGLERNEFFLEYQPLVHLDSGQTVGMEALVRWNHPERGIVYPGEFIPVAEESGFIVQLGEWVLRQACKQNKQWQKAGYRPICVSVNLSMGQFIQTNLPDRVKAVLNEIGLEPKYVELEITESMTLDKEAALGQLHSLKRLGVNISIDDFGTGYSSLHYLKNLPIDRLKIDRAFINEVLQDNNNAAIVSTIATMAHHLKLKVTAEGVETEDQLSFLRKQQCHEGQGYYFSRPVRALDFERTFLVC